jgi:GrpB-like predicted nucleotidyltransferase (UPF0157 family)
LDPDVNAGGDPIIIVPADPRWSEEFVPIGKAIRSALGPLALRIDHVGSTAVPGLDAKPVIDIQVSVPTLEPSDPFGRPLGSIGFVPHPNNPDRTQRFFREPPGIRRVHLHVRRAGSFDEQLNLMFRDYLRTHPDAAQEYAQRKRELAIRFRNDREAYVRAKEPTVWSLLVRAHDWAQGSGWHPGPTDA